MESTEHKKAITNRIPAPSDYTQDRFRVRFGCASSCLRVTVLLFIMVSSLQAQFRSTQWTADSGLPQNIIRGIVQTHDGYLWVATLNGVAQFDGVRFRVFDKSNTPGITANRFAVMVQGKDGDLWFCTESGAITRYPVMSSIPWEMQRVHLRAPFRA
jgi:ligand-binding sensor domain-containing protein